MDMQIDNLHLRSVTHADIDEIFCLNNQIFEKSIIPSKETIRYLISMSPGFTVYNNDEFAGYILTCPLDYHDEIFINFAIENGISNSSPSVRLFTITELAVRPEYRRRGIARKLMNMIIQNMQQRYSHIILEVKVTNTPAINLYINLGFTIYGVINDYYTEDDGIAIDGYLMYLKT